MTNSVFDPIAGVPRERDATLAFIDVLRREQHALQHSDASLLLSLATEKARHAQQLAQLTNTRNCWLAMSGYSQDRVGMERGLQDWPAAADSWRDLLQLAETANELNNINSIIVGQRLRYNQQRLSALQAATRSAQGAGLYGSDGQPQPFPGGRMLGEV